MIKYKEFTLLLEKRIGQIISNIEINYSLDVITTIHSFDRSKGIRQDILNYNTTPISNKEICELIDHFKKIIAEKIFFGEIKNEIDFVIKSKSRLLSLAIIPLKKGENWWSLIIKTVFRESNTHSFFTSSNQLIIED